MTTLDILQKHSSLVQTVQQTTSEVFSTMLGIELTKLPPSTTMETTTRNAGLLSIVGMAGAVSGSGSLSLSKRFSCYASSRFLMQDPEYQEVNDDVLDAVAELSNMIVGGVKTVLEEQFGPMGLSVPQIVCGDGYLTRSFSAGDRIQIPFECKEDNLNEVFNVTICIVDDRSKPIQS